MRLFCSGKMNAKFSFEFIVTIFILCLAFSSSLKHKRRPCIQNGPCECLFPNGDGINISKLADHEFGWIKVNASTDIFFKPCVDSAIGTNTASNECYTGTSICIRVQAGNDTKFVDLGKSVDGKFSSPLNPNEPISLRFLKNNRATVIEFYCNENKSSLSNLTASEKNGDYVLQLSSPQVCVGVEPSNPSRLSVGSALVIILIIFTLIYFGGGILTLKFLRGAEGKEMIPNYEFWADLPYLVRDGILFAINGCQPSPTYDRI